MFKYLPALFLLLTHLTHAMDNFENLHRELVANGIDNTPAQYPPYIPGKLTPRSSGGDFLRRPMLALDTATPEDRAIANNWHTISSGSIFYPQSVEDRPILPKQAIYRNYDDKEVEELFSGVSSIKYQFTRCENKEIAHELFGKFCKCKRCRSVLTIFVASKLDVTRK